MSGTCDELKPCPFCGCEDIDEYEGDFGNGVYCMNCGAMMGEPIHMEFRTNERVSYEQAIEAWNTRATLGGWEREDVSVVEWGTVPVKLDFTEDKSRYAELFGTPERAAQTLEEFELDHLNWCRGTDCCEKCPYEFDRYGCCLPDGFSLLAWLRGEA